MIRSRWLHQHDPSLYFLQKPSVSRRVAIYSITRLFPDTSQNFETSKTYNLTELNPRLSKKSTVTTPKGSWSTREPSVVNTKKRNIANVCCPQHVPVHSQLITCAACANTNLFNSPVAIPLFACSPTVTLHGQIPYTSALVSKS